MQNKDFWRHTKTERINHQQTGTIRNERNPSDKRKMIPEQKPKMQRGMKKANTWVNWINVDCTKQ